MTGQILLYEKMGDSAVIRRCFSHEDTAVIPEYIDGLPVTEIGAYAFSAHMDPLGLPEAVEKGHWKISPPVRCEWHLSNAGWEMVCEDHDVVPALCGERVFSVRLPGSVRKVGRYCFYNCSHLERLDFHAALGDWGSGVFTGCHRLSLLRFYAAPGDPVRLKNALDELPDALTVEYLDLAGSTVLRLVFPEFYEEGVENTPARILMTEIHGSGIRYRNSFRFRVLDLELYDRLFPYAVTEEPFEVSSALAEGRLLFPYGLSGEAETAYRDFCRKHWEQLAAEYLSSRRIDSIRWLLENILENDPVMLERILEMARDAQCAEAVSYLLDHRRSFRTDRRPAGRRRLSFSGGERR